MRFSDCCHELGSQNDLRFQLIASVYFRPPKIFIKNLLSGTKTNDKRKPFFIWIVNHLLDTSNMQLSFQSLSNYPEIKFVTLFDIHRAVLLNRISQTVWIIDQFIIRILLRWGYKTRDNNFIFSLSYKACSLNISLDLVLQYNFLSYNY